MGGSSRYKYELINLFCSGHVLSLSLSLVCVCVTSQICEEKHGFKTQNVLFSRSSACLHQQVHTQHVFRLKLRTFKGQPAQSFCYWALSSCHVSPVLPWASCSWMFAQRVDDSRSKDRRTHTSMQTHVQDLFRAGPAGTVSVSEFQNCESFILTGVSV